MNLLPGWVVRLTVIVTLVAAVCAGAAWFVHSQREMGREQGRAEIRAEWTAAKLAESESNAKETKRRVERQEENQRAQNEELAAARRDADRARVAVNRVRSDHETAARQWRRALADSPTRADLEAAATAIGVCTELLGRARERDRIVSTYSTAARAAGLKCERDYESLRTEP